MNQSFEVKEVIFMNDVTGISSPIINDEEQISMMMMMGSWIYKSSCAIENSKKP